MLGQHVAVQEQQGGLEVVKITTCSFGLDDASAAFSWGSGKPPNRGMITEPVPNLGGTWVGWGFITCLSFLDDDGCSDVNCSWFRVTKMSISGGVPIGDDLDE